MSGPVRPRAVAFALIGSLLLFLLLELTLRIAGAAWLSLNRADSSHQEADLTVWTAGDSYTFGLGAPDPATQSYPAQLVDRLQTATRSVALHNLAVPGFNSSEAVASLGHELGRSRAEGALSPDVILLLAGVNNTRWLGNSGQFCLDEPGAQTPVRAPSILRELRIFRVLHWALSPRLPRSSCDEVAAGFQFLEDGLPEDAQQAFWRAKHANPESRWARVGLALSLSRVARNAEAIPHFEAALEAGLDSPALALAYGFALRAEGRSEQAAQISSTPQAGQLQAFAELLDAWLAYDRGDLTAAAAAFDELVVAGGRAGDVREGAVLPFALDGRGWTLLRLGQQDLAAEAFERANEVGAPLGVTPHLMGWSHVGLAVLAASKGDRAEVQSQLREVERDSGAAPGARAWQQLRSTASGDTPIPRPVPTPAVQRWFRLEDTRLVEADLARAAALAEAAEARLIVLTYPQPNAHGELADALRRATDRLGVTFIDPRPTFQAELDAGTPWDALLVPDGHPTARGYGLMAQLVAQALAP